MEMVLDALNDSGANANQVQMIDSTVIRAHNLAPGAKGDPKQGFGHSKGGFTTKIHLIANAHGLPVWDEVSGGEVSDFKGFDALVDSDLPEARVFIADRATTANTSAARLSSVAAHPLFPVRSTEKKPMLVNSITRALRNRREHWFNKLKCSHRLATRYDKTAASYISFIQIAATRLWIRSLSTRPR